MPALRVAEGRKKGRTEARRWAILPGHVIQSELSILSNTGSANHAVCNEASIQDARRQRHPLVTGVGQGYVYTPALRLERPQDRLVHGP